MDNAQVVMKVLVLGDQATGKTSIIKRSITNSFSDLHKPTIGVDFHYRKFEMSGTNVGLQLWDIAGQDRFGTLYRIYYRDAFGVLLVFDLTRPETFHSVLRWKREIDSKVQLPNGKPLPVVLLANKCDLPNPAVNKDQLDAFCKEHGFVSWFETSAKDNKNIEEAVKGLVANILSHPDALQAQTEQKKADEAAKAAGGTTLSLGGKEEAKPSAGGCC